MLNIARVFFIGFNFKMHKFNKLHMEAKCYII